MSSDSTSVASFERHGPWFHTDSNKSPLSGQQLHTMSLWSERSMQFFHAFIGILGVCVIYLSSELLIWGISICLDKVNVRFLSSILGMFVVFSFATAVMTLWHTADVWYYTHLKSKLDLINRHLGVAFAMPLVVLDESHALNSDQIGRVIAAFVITAFFFWVCVYMFAYCFFATWEKILQMWRPDPGLVEHVESWNQSDTSYHGDSSQSDDTLVDEKPTAQSWHRMPLWNLLAAHWPIWTSFFLVFLVGVPLACTSTDRRVLDGSLLWFIWMTSVRIHAWVRSKATQSSWPGLMEAVSIVVNPVILTTLTMTAYIHLSAFAMGYPSALSQIRRFISSGSPLYEIWTAGVQHVTLPNNPTSWFGAGDFALSILECGLVLWGFKLYECRRQLFSVKGALVCVVSIGIAVGNTFQSVCTASLVGVLPGPALSFAARNTTLALAKPAMEALGGNKAVNAALVVVNGMVGYVLYPWALPRLEALAKKGALRNSTTDSSTDDEYGSPNVELLQDDPVTIAIGITVGTNGLAMGVAYLYATKHRAAPYSVLAMTVFGVMTVVLSTVEPFKSALIQAVYP